MDLATLPEQHTLDVEATLNLDAIARILHRLAHDLAGRNADDNLIDELVQAGRVGIWKKSHLYDPARAAVTTFAHMAAKSSMIDHLRSAANRHDASMVHEHTVTAGGTLDDHDIDELASEILTEPKRFLPRRQAEVVEALQRYRTHAEARAALNITPDAWRCALHRARRRIAGLSV